MRLSFVQGSATGMLRKGRWFRLITAYVINIAAAVSVSGHPNVYLNQKEIEAIQGRVASGGELWTKSAMGKVIAEAQTCLSQAPLSVTFQGNPGHDYHTMRPYDWSNNMPSPCGRPRCDGQVNPKADRGDYEAAINLSSAVRGLGLAYSLTGDAEYAEKVISLIRVWCLDPATSMKPSVFGDQAIEQFITFPGLFYGADLIWNYPGWERRERQSFSRWVRNFAESVVTVNYCNNWENCRQVFLASAGALLDDPAFLNQAFDSFRANLPSQIGSDGRMVKELSRTLSLDYSIFALNGMTQLAEIAHDQGIDLYGYSSDGRSLSQAWDFHARYVIAPSSWPWQQIKPFDGDGVALYELAYKHSQKSFYLDVIKWYGRPLYEKRTMGPVSLTHSLATSNSKNGCRLSPLRTALLPDL